MKKTVFLVALLAFTGFAASQSSVQIDVELKKTEPVPVQSSEYADIWIEVTNEGNNDANNVELEFMENYPFSADPDEKTSWDLGTLNPGEEYQIHLETRVDENAVQGDNTINFRSTSSTGVSVLHKIPVEVRSDNAILSIDRTYFPSTVRPGSSNRMTLQLRNMADSQLKNIQVELDTSDEDLPMATQGSSVVNLENINPGNTRNVSFNINVDESAENAVYKLPVNLEYENEAGTAFTTETLTGVRVGGEPELQVAVNNEEQLTRGTQTVNFRIVNRGYGSAEFLELEIPRSGENYRVISPNSVYIGEMDPDDFQTAEFSMYFSSENVTVPVQLRYRDADGEKIQLERVELDVYSQQDLQRYGVSTGNNLLPIIAVGLAVLAGAVYYWRRRRKRKQRQ